MAKVYFHQHFICDGKLLCPRVDDYVSEKACRTKCRFYYGRGAIRFAENFNPENPREPGEPEERVVSKWHICNMPDGSDHLNEIADRERKRIIAMEVRK